MDEPARLTSTPRVSSVPPAANGTGQCRECHLVPRDPAERRAIEQLAEQYAIAESLVAPLSWEELILHRDQFMRRSGLAPQHRHFATVLLNNAVWRPVLRGIPFERRVLLLPQCLRDSGQCRAVLDEFGLLCMECGACPIGAIQQQAERLGYAVVVSEGTTLVTQMIRSGAVQAVVGVSCLAVLERAFPDMAAHAIPGIAIPLLHAGCVRTEVDRDWLERMLGDYTPNAGYQRLDLDILMHEVRAWFEPAQLAQDLDAGKTSTERLAFEWMCAGGKRWRPALTAAVYRALTGARSTPLELRKVAVAVECFHKASLVHDDIADHGEERYGQPTLHRRAGVAVALNAGDLLIGEGYRLLVDCGYDPKICSDLVQIAARGHRSLCLGQGEELAATRGSCELSVDQILRIFKDKTAPAFAVALGVGAVCAGAGWRVRQALDAYSEFLGTAYQIKDDLDDAEPDRCGAAGAGPSLLEALRRKATRDRILRAAGAAKHAGDQARELMENYRAGAIRAVSGLRNSDLKTLLHRLCSRILPDRP